MPRPKFDDDDDLDLEVEGRKWKRHGRDRGPRRSMKIDDFEVAFDFSKVRGIIFSDHTIKRWSERGEGSLEDAFAASRPVGQAAARRMMARGVASGDPDDKYMLSPSGKQMFVFKVDGEWAVVITVCEIPRPTWSPR